MDIRQDRIDEISSMAKEYKFSERTIVKLIDKKHGEQRLHDFVWMLRDNLPEDLINFVADKEYDNVDIRLITKAYHSDEILNTVLYLSVQNDNLELIRKIFKSADDKRETFLYQLLSNSLFDKQEVYNFLCDNKTIYIKHEFNWRTYESRMVLEGENNKMYFPIPEIPLIGGCWSNYVAQRMLMGQMHLNFIFKAIKSSLEFHSETQKLDCKIVSCDNCFYAPYLYFYIDKDGKIDNGIGKNCEKVYMDYLIKEYPVAYQWLQNRTKGEYFYDDFYVKYMPEM